ncbi:unnamed protein product [Echinostoma caproni]|uniref:CLASP_N domain-containing protein n=1 Tax=Echinostoma caproni TaxID=27848 RepID=A0A183BB22_9TREM|nr:unnamed protein product [Echinostoma caproni]
MSVHGYCRRFANQLLNRQSTTDIQLAALEARLLGEFSLVFPYDFIEEQEKHACEILLSDASDAQKQFAILVLRELVLNAPTSFFQQFGAFVCAIVSAFRDKNAATRELASVTLRSAFELAAAREQRNRLGVLVNSGSGFAGVDTVRGLEFQGTTTSDSTDAFGFSRAHCGSHGGIRNSISHDTSIAGLSRSTTSHSSSPIDWYRNCLIEAFRAFPAPGTTGSSSDQNMMVSAVFIKANTLYCVKLQLQFPQFWYEIPVHGPLFENNR